MPRGVKGQNGLRFEMLTSAQRPGCQLLLRRHNVTKQISFPLPIAQEKKRVCPNCRTMEGKGMSQGWV